LVEPQRPGDVRALQSQFAQKFRACRVIASKDIQPEKATDPNLTAAAAGRTPNLSITMAIMAGPFMRHTIDGNVTRRSSRVL
jgi:hypothetical protein